ncbi:MAG TPA: outer membrane protein assembly factor BamD [Patescibacteria group bacterium]|nr:outer membrane protein assembly factor BamD [Patescibacteria group bacterium]
MQKLRHFLPLFALCAILLTGCSHDKKDKTQDEQPVEVLYNKAADAMAKQKYDEASKNFDEVERQHPYSPWAVQAELMSAYASYKNEKYDEAEAALDRFIELHPGNKDIDYALYLKALCSYEQIGDVARDQGLTKQALDDLETLIRRFPDSRYARDASIKRDLTLDHLAGKEMDVGRYYLHRHEINAAVNRFLTVVKDYQTTTHVPEALERLVECYMTLGLNDQATKVAAVLGYNYPGSKWYARAYKLMDPRQREQLKNGNGWMNRTVDSLFKPD